MTDDERTERIRQRAYEIWEKEGKRDGDHERHWQEAADEIEKEDGPGNAADLTDGGSALTSDLHPGDVQSSSDPGRSRGRAGSEAKSPGRSDTAAARRSSRKGAGAGRRLPDGGSSQGKGE
ncbi:DUF2934 domain-containing protein [Sinorhizobium meliloti]|uniref:DUF2934 domain-containing protein n=1 Tax=Rhizobium meliloti TaxID=382 RepID=UPI00398C8882